MRTAYIFFIVGVIVVTYNFFVLYLYYFLCHATAVTRIITTCSNAPKLGILELFSCVSHSVCCGCSDPRGPD
jgi:hypothetical protein